MSDEGNIVAVPASIPVPSADLITYRFDQVDKQLTHFEGKLDSITNSFATKEELANISKDVEVLQADVGALKSTDSRQQGSIDANRRIISIALTIFGIFVGAVATYAGVHK